jgi:L-fucose isomerase-like protein
MTSAAIQPPTTHAATTTFALFIGNRGFFPASLLGAARAEMTQVLNALGHKVLTLAPDATRHGAVETSREGEIFADFLRANRGAYDGVIVCLPNFGDETGAITALKDAGVPILIHAYPDELNRMAPTQRRDAFCGKLSVMDVFCQHGLPFTALTPHVVHPRSDAFAANIDYFDRVCRVCKATKGMVVGAIGARTTAFKTVRIDELALQKIGITTETLDLSNVLGRVNTIKTNDARFVAKADRLRDYTGWDDVPLAAFEKLVDLGVVLDEVIDEYRLDAIAFRCWLEIQEQVGISACVILSELNDRGIAAACEVDVGNAVLMHAIARASGSVAACLDWNNNYGEERDKCILFHCGPVPQRMMTAKGQVVDHVMVHEALGKGRSYGCNVGRIAPTPFTFGSLLTRDGSVECYLGEGEFTNDPIPSDFFGCAGVARIDHLQTILQQIGYLGHRHHVSVTPGHVAAPALEAMTKYLGFKTTLLGAPTLGSGASPASGILARRKDSGG